MDSDEIRRKRIERLQTINTNSESNSKTIKQNIQDSDKKLNKLENLNKNVNQNAVKNSSSVEKIDKVKKISTQLESFSIQDWTNNTISQVFSVTLSTDINNNINNDKILFLKSMHDEYTQENLPLKFTNNSIDSLILCLLTEYRNSMPSQSQPFEYLISCYKKAMLIKKTIKLNSKYQSEKLITLNEIQRLCISYATLNIASPEMFDEKNSFLHYLLITQDSPKYLSFDILEKIVNKTIEDDLISVIFENTFSNLSKLTNSITMTDNYQNYFRILRDLISFKPLANYITTLPNFLPSEHVLTNDVLQIEFTTILGAFFKISPVNPKVANVYIPKGTTTLTPAEFNPIASSLQAELHSIQQSLFYISDKIIRSSEKARNTLINYFSLIANANHKRRAIQLDITKVSSDAFMLNITSVLTKLSGPFIDNTTFAKIDKVDPAYFLKKTYLNITEETKINSDLSNSKKFYSESMQSDIIPNFISHVFFLNIAFHNYGFVGAAQNLHNIEDDISEMEKNIEHVEAERPNWEQSPRAPFFRASLERLKDKLAEAISYKYVVQAALFDETSLSNSLSFLSFLGMWLIRVIDPNNLFPSQPISLPILKSNTKKSDGTLDLSVGNLSTPPDVFSNYPEYFIEVVASFIITVSREFPRVLFDASSDRCITEFCTVFLRQSSYVKNPFLKSKLVEVLFHGCMQQRESRNGFLGDTLNSDKLALEYLFHALMQFYIDIEVTGASSQFYDKFNIRYYISQVIKFIWNNNVYQSKLLYESKHNSDFFVRFVALLLNDVTYLLDEALSKLAEIHNLQIELNEDNSNTNEQTDQERNQTRSRLDTAERQATSYMSLGNETVAMLKLFTAAAPDCFVTVEIVDRLAAMLDYNLVALVGPRCTGLKVKNPLKYQFNPKVLLSDIVDVYLNLLNFEKFAIAIANDGRSYNHDLFTRATNILEKYGLKSSKDTEKLIGFANRVEKIKENQAQDEKDLGEVPDEFLDPLMYTIMQNPVILPTSHISIDLATIKSHLLSDSTDPFNRSPLKLEDCKPDVELKKKIDEFLSAGKKKSEGK